VYGYMSNESMALSSVPALTRRWSIDLNAEVKHAACVVRRSSAFRARIPCSACRWRLSSMLKT
jgi:hypothetical protein